MCFSVLPCWGNIGAFWGIMGQWDPRALWLPTPQGGWQRRHRPRLPQRRSGHHRGGRPRLQLGRSAHCGSREDLRPLLVQRDGLGLFVAGLGQLVVGWA